MTICWLFNMVQHYAFTFNGCLKWSLNYQFTNYGQFRMCVKELHECVLFNTVLFFTWKDLIFLYKLTLALSFLCMSSLCFNCSMEFLKYKKDADFHLSRSEFCINQYFFCHFCVWVPFFSIARWTFCCITVTKDSDSSYKGPEIWLLLLPLPGKVVPVGGISFTSWVGCSRSPPSKVVMAISFSWNRWLSAPWLWRRPSC